MARWTWTEKGVAIDDDAGARQEFARIDNPSLIPAFAAQFAIPRTVLSLLQSARMAFAGGRANYADAADNISDLINELGKAEARAIEAAWGVSALFDPAGVHVAFEKDGRGLIDFASDAVQRSVKNAI